MIADGINRVGVSLSDFALLSLLALTLYSVTARYVFRSPSIHALEISVYLLLIVAWGSIGWILRAERHVRMDALYVKLPRAARAVADLVSVLSILVFSGVLIWAGTVNALTAFNRGYRSSSLLAFPMWIPYLLIPLGGGLLLLVALYKIFDIGARKNAGDPAL
jgi:C4-dicarboxylate transporter, DctQ subunit